jgi:ABC-type multidrug transport system fused ATPase/permease subunit
MSALSEETLSVSGVLLAKVFGSQARDTARYHQENQRLADLEVRQQMIGQGFYAIVQSFLSITPAAVYLIAGLLLAHGTAISAGTIVAFTTLQTRLYFPVAPPPRPQRESPGAASASSAIWVCVANHVRPCPAIAVITISSICTR